VHDIVGGVNSLLDLTVLVGRCRGMTFRAQHRERKKVWEELSNSWPLSP
jgi:hypothetical protein